MTTWTSAGPKKKRSEFLQELIRNYQLFIMILPGTLFLFIMNYSPLPGLLIAFKNYNFTDGILGSPWVGFDNFEFFFTSETAWRVTRNTLVMNGLMILTGTFASVTLALVINHLRNRRFKKITQSIMIFPSFISWVIVSFFVLSLFDYQFGVLNTLLLHMEKEPVAWYETPWMWYFIIPLAGIWKSAGYGAIVYLAAIAGIDEEIFEAAEIDGATKLQQNLYVTLPNLVPLITIMLLLAVGNIFRADFGMFYNMTLDNPTLYEVTDVIDTNVYRSLRTGGDYGMSTAIGLYQSVVGFLLVLGTNLLVKWKRPENSLF